MHGKMPKSIFGELIEFKGVSPTVDESAFIANGARLIGDVRIEEGASVWFNAVLRGDINYVYVGKFSNIQDLCLMHVEKEEACIVEDFVVVGHMAILHGCRIGSFCLIGMGAKVLTGAEVGEGSIIGAGTVILENSKIPPRSLVVGVPGKVVRSVSEDEVKHIKAWAERYNGYARDYLEILGA